MHLWNDGFSIVMWVFGGVFEIDLNIAEILTAASTFSRPLWFALDLINASRLAGHGTRWVFPSFSHHFPLGRCMMDLKRSQKEFVYVITPKKGKRNMNHKTFVLCFQKAKGPWTPKTFDFIWCSFVLFLGWYLYPWLVGFFTLNCHFRFMNMEFTKRNSSLDITN